MKHSTASFYSLVTILDIQKLPQQIALIHTYATTGRLVVHIYRWMTSGPETA